MTLLGRVAAADGANLWSRSSWDFDTADAVVDGENGFQLTYFVHLGIVAIVTVSRYIVRGLTNLWSYSSRDCDGDRSRGMLTSGPVRLGSVVFSVKTRCRAR